MSSLLESTNTSAPIVIAIGPEGDFAPEEEALLTTRHAFAPISLGSSILRSELAVVSAIISVRIHDERCANTN
jgi:RsmE family RNA methyltransferase